MSANEQEILTGMEPYRDPYQKLMGYDQDTSEYTDAQTELYEELEIDTDIDTMDQLHICRLVNRGEVETSFEYLKKQVLEND